MLIINVKTPVAFLGHVEEMQTVFLEIISDIVYAHLDIPVILFLVVFPFNTARMIADAHQELSVLTIYVLVSEFMLFYIVVFTMA